MRGDITGLGIVLIVLSIALFFVAPVLLGLEGLCVLWLPCTIMGIAGILTFIGGLIAKSTQPTTVVHYQAPMQPQSNVCPTCGYPLEWIAQRQMNYCHRCKRYF